MGRPSLNTQRLSIYPYVVDLLQPAKALYGKTTDPNLRFEVYVKGVKFSEWSNETPPELVSLDVTTEHGEIIRDVVCIGGEYTVPDKVLCWRPHIPPSEVSEWRNDTPAEGDTRALTVESLSGDTFKGVTYRQGLFHTGKGTVLHNPAKWCYENPAESATRIQVGMPEILHGIARQCDTLYEEYGEALEVKVYQLLQTIKPNDNGPQSYEEYWAELRH